MTSLNVPAGMVRISRRLVSLQGLDAAKFLQGMISAATLTRDGAILPRRPGAAIYSGMFNAQGRLVNDLMVYPVPPRDETQATPDYLIEVDGEHAPSFMKALMFYKLRSNFGIRLVKPGEWDVWHIWDDAKRLGERSGEKDGEGGGFLSRDPRVPGLGYRWLGRNDEAPPVEAERVSEDAYRLRRYLNGVAEGQDEMKRFIGLPMEYNMDLMHGIDFHKGCYVGQEMQARTKYRGVVQKRVLPVMLYPEDAPMPGRLEYKPNIVDGDAELVAETIKYDTGIRPTDKESKKRERPLGRWVAGMGNVGLAVCKMSVMTDVMPPVPPNVQLPQPPSAKSGAEFQIEVTAEGKMVKVKAFVPPWLRKGLETYHD